MICGVVLMFKLGQEQGRCQSNNREKITYGRLSATAPTVGAGSPTTSDNLRTPGDETCYPWRTPCKMPWRTTFATKRRTIMGTTPTDYTWQLGIDWEAIPTMG